MKKIALIGNPNVGKSLVFSRITGIAVVSANYVGTTVGVKIGRFKFHGDDYELFDSPGLYSLEAFSKADEAALKLIEDCDIIVNVVDATNLERNLNLTLQLIDKGKPLVVCLNFWDETKHKGISLDEKALDALLGVPVVPTSANKNEGITALVETLENARSGKRSPPDTDRWSRIGSIISAVQKMEHRHHTLLERLGDFTLHPVGGLITAILALFSTFFLVRLIGEGLVNHLCRSFICAALRSLHPFRGRPCSGRIHPGPFGGPHARSAAIVRHPDDGRLHCARFSISLFFFVLSTIRFFRGFRILAEACGCPRYVFPPHRASR